MRSTTAIKLLKLYVLAVFSVFLNCRFCVYGGPVNCYKDHRLPKILQTSTSSSDNQAEAIIASSALNSIFIGGHISQS